MQKGRESEVGDVSQAFGLSSWKLDGDQCGRSRCGGEVTGSFWDLSVLRYLLGIQVESRASSYMREVGIQGEMQGGEIIWDSLVYRLHFTQ